MSLTTVSSRTSRSYVSRPRHGTHSMGFVDVAYPMVAGLALRVVLDAATLHSVRLSGTLIGLWEGVILLHYLRRCKSADPAYLGYAVRVLVDFGFTESVFRLVVVLLWTTVGMVLADVAPAVWTETGLNRQWDRFRRDLSRSMRILLSQGPRAMASRSSTESTPSPASTPPIGPRRPPKRPVPGTFPGAEWSETETRPSTVVEEDEDDDLYSNEGAYEDTDMPSVFLSRPSHGTRPSTVVEADEEDDDDDLTTDDEAAYAGTDMRSVFPSQPSHVTIVPIIVPSSQASSEPDEDANTFALTTPPLSPVSYRPHIPDPTSRPTSASDIA
ncbi:hypothetical protein B0H19DRAFT_1012494 [Mycena capillaripes]|nr:hypothetical protein B0H19DRAFT_1012494 [Mycena capillaripes]